MSVRSWLAFLVLALPPSTHAATVTWVFEGSISGTYDGSAIRRVNVPELTSLGVVAGTPFIATFTIDLDTPDLNASATFGRYDDAVVGVSFEASGYSFSFSGMSDSQELFVNMNEQILAAYYGGPGGYFDVPLFFLEVEAAQPGVFASDAIPSPFPAIDSLEPFRFPNSGDGFGYGSWIVVYAGVTMLGASISSHYALPEPAAAALAGFAVLALAALRSRRSS